MKGFPHIQFLLPTQAVHITLIDPGEGDCRLRSAIAEIFLWSSRGTDMLSSFPIVGVDVPKRIFGSHDCSKSEVLQKMSRIDGSFWSTRQTQRKKNRGAYTPEAKYKL